jgi:VWFA-related protein
VARFTLPAAAVLLVLVSAPPVAAQVHFRAETTVVYLDVVVRDAAGRPVTDLEAADFEVREDGGVQQLVWFDRSNAAASAALAGSAKAASPALVPATDLPEGPPQSIFAIVFHQLTAQPRAYATQAAHALVDHLAPGDSAGVYVFDRELTELASFTGDRQALHRAIRTASVTPPAFRETAYARGSAEDGGSEVPATVGDPSLWSRAMRPFEAVREGTALRGLVAVLDAYVGRRAIVLFSEGLAVPEVIPRLELVVDAAASAHVSFYTIDAGGLRARSTLNPSPRRLTAAELSSVSDPSQIRPARIPEMDLSHGLRPLAELTGGLYVSDTNDLKAALARVDADRRSYYVLAYRATTGGPASTRAIAVRVKRPDTNVRARSSLGRFTAGAGTPKRSQSQD